MTGGGGLVVRDARAKKTSRAARALPRCRSGTRGEPDLLDEPAGAEDIEQVTTPVPASR